MSATGGGGDQKDSKSHKPIIPQDNPAYHSAKQRANKTKHPNALAKEQAAASAAAAGGGGGGGGSGFAGVNPQSQPSQATAASVGSSGGSGMLPGLVTAVKKSGNNTNALNSAPVSHIPTPVSVEVIAYDPALEEIDLTNCRCSDFDQALTNLKQLKKLVLRQNQIERVSADRVSALAGSLTELDLYENRIGAIADCHLQPLQKLVWLDLSFNSIRTIDTSLTPLIQLRELYLVNNKISVIEGLDSLTELRLLELGSNKLRAISGLDKLIRLEQLWLGRNKITGLGAGLANLKSLKKLSLQSNRLIDIGDGLAHCSALEELYISHNGLTSVKGFERLTALRVLDVGTNRVASLDGLQPLTKLEELWANNNLISTWEDVSQHVAKTATLLNTIYLEGNASAVSADPQYKSKVIALFPRLTQLDSTPL